MGTRKRTGKGRHDKKGKGKKHHKKQHPQHEDWEPTGSGQESDTQSEPERSEPPTSSKQRRQRGHASANGKVHVDRATAGGWGWTPYIIGLVLCAGLAVTAPYLIQYYHLSGLDLTSFFSQSAKEKMPHSQPDFGQEGASDKSFGTDKQHSDDCGDDETCLRHDTFDQDHDDTYKFEADTKSEKGPDLDIPTDMNTDSLNVDPEGTDDLQQDFAEMRSTPAYPEEVIPEPSVADKSHFESRTDLNPDEIPTEEYKSVPELDITNDDLLEESVKTQHNENIGDQVNDEYLDDARKQIDDKDLESTGRQNDDKDLEDMGRQPEDKHLGDTARKVEDHLLEDISQTEQNKVINEAESVDSAKINVQNQKPTELSEDEILSESANTVTSLPKEADESLSKDSSEVTVSSSEELNKQHLLEKEPEHITELPKSEFSQTNSTKQNFLTKEDESESDQNLKSSEVEEKIDSSLSGEAPSNQKEQSGGVGGGELDGNTILGGPDDDKHSTPEPERPQRSTYPKADITNTVDNKIRHELDEADSLLEKKHLGEAEAKYRHILSRYPRSPRATYGLAQTFCNQAEEQLSNALLEQCIEEYQKIIDLPDVPRTLMLKAGRTCVERQQFRGWGYKAVKLIKRLLDMYPDEMQLWNELGVQYLMIGRYNEAKSAFLQMLQSDPNNVYAKAHLGFIYKTGDNDPAQAVPLLRDALSSGDKSVQDGRFYFQLGDALQRLGNVSEAYIWYEKGESLGLFLSKHQRSLYNVEDLTGRPWWTKEQTGQQKLIEVLEENWKVIRDEGLANIDKTGSFRPEDENLRETGDWKQFTLFQQGRKNEQNCKRAPKTCALIERFPAASTCKRGQVKYSIMQPGVHVWPHCGPTNCRIRMHLGLVVPKDCCRIRVVDDIRTWQEGKVLVFDDSFEHEVWHNGTDLRLVLIVDIWHPELTSRQKASLSPI